MKISGFRRFGRFRAKPAQNSNSTENFSIEAAVPEPQLARPAPFQPKTEFYPHFSAFSNLCPPTPLPRKHRRPPKMKTWFFWFSAVFGPSGPREHPGTWTFQYRTPRYRAVSSKPRQLLAETAFVSQLFGQFQVFPPVTANPEYSRRPPKRP